MSPTDPRANVVNDWNLNREILGPKIKELAERIHPAVWNFGTLYKIDETKIDLFATAFSWNPTTTEKLDSAHCIATVKTQHIAEQVLLFKPTVAQVLSQLPEKYLDSKEHLYFTTKTDQHPIFSLTPCGKFHTATTKLYRA